MVNVFEFPLVDINTEYVLLEKPTLGKLAKVS